MSNKTTNFGLTKPSQEDFYDVQVHNGNMDIIDAEMKKFTPATDHNVKTYTALSQIGLSSSDMSETDTLMNFISIFNAMSNQSFLCISMGTSPNLSKSITAKLQTDLGVTVISYMDVQFFRSGSNMLQVDVELQYYSENSIYPANKYSCVLRYTEGSVEYLSPFILTRSRYGFYSPKNKPTPADIGAVPTTRTVNGKALDSDVDLTAADVGLGNVPNVSTNNQTPTYSKASSLSNLVSGEKLTTSFGKIMKAIADLISHIGNTSNPHGVTASQIGGAITATYTAKVTWFDWVWDSEEKYAYQDITVSGILATDNPIPSVAYGEDNDANVIYNDCFGMVEHITTFDNKIRVWTKEDINTTFPIQLKVVR